MTHFTQGDVGNRGLLGSEGPPGVPGTQGPRLSKGVKGYAGLMVNEPFLFVNQSTCLYHHLFICCSVPVFFTMYSYFQGQGGLMGKVGPLGLLGQQVSYRLPLRKDLYYYIKGDPLFVSFFRVSFISF